MLSTFSVTMLVSGLVCVSLGNGPRGPPFRSIRGYFAEPWFFILCMNFISGMKEPFGGQWNMPSDVGTGAPEEGLIPLESLPCA